VRPLRRKLAATLLGMTVLATPLLAGCASGDTDTPNGDPTGTASGTAAGFPSKVRAANGTVSIPAKPKRIISLSPTATEMLYAIGAGGQVTAVDDQSTYPKNAPRSKLSGFKPNAEAIIAKSPDLVVLSNDANGVVKALTKVKIPVILAPSATKLDDSYRQIATLGTATGHADTATSVVSGMKKKIADTVAKTKKPKKHLTYYHELDDTYHSATSKTFIGQVYGLFGLRNIADKAKDTAGGYPKLSSEYVVEADPDLVFLADSACCGQSAAKVAKRPGWKRMTAVHTHSVVALPADIPSRWGPRIVQFVKQVSTAVQKAGSAQ